MERIKELKIAAQEFRLNFSTRAAKAVMERYGGLDKINDAIFATSKENKDTRSVVEIAEEVAWLLSLLMQEGAAYARVVEQKEVPALTAEDLQIIMSAAELMEARGPVLEAIGAGLSPTVETEPDAKNAEATQSK